MASRNLILLVVIALVGRTLGSPEARKQFTRCEVYNYVRAQGSAVGDARTWTCIANYESGYNSAAMGGPNSNGSYDHGMWQVNDNYWCYNPNRPGLSNDCNVNCSALRDSVLDDDWTCVVKIFGRHGWTAWSTYTPYCSGASTDTQWSNGC